MHTDGSTKKPALDGSRHRRASHLTPGPECLDLSIKFKNRIHEQSRPGKASEGRPALPTDQTATHCPWGTSMVKDREEKFVGKAGPGFRVEHK